MEISRVEIEIQKVLEGLEDRLDTWIYDAERVGEHREDLLKYTTEALHRVVAARDEEIRRLVQTEWKKIPYGFGLNNEAQDPKIVQVAMNDAFATILNYLKKSLSHSEDKAAIRAAEESTKEQIDLMKKAGVDFDKYSEDKGK